MLISCGVLGVVSLGGMVYYLTKGNNAQTSKRNYICLVTLVLSIVHGLRGAGVGIDTSGYHMIFEQCVVLPFWESFNVYGEFGMILLYRFVALFTTNSQFGIFALSFLFLSLIGLFLYKLDINTPYAYYLFICSGIFANSMNIIRQFIACAFLCNALLAYWNKKWLTCTVLVFFAFAFHMSSLIFILVLVVLNFVHNKTHYIIISTLSIIAIFFVDKLVLWFFFLFPKYSHYAESEFLARTTQISFGILIYISMIIVSLFAFLFSQRTIKQNTTGVKLLIQDNTIYTFAWFSLLYAVISIAAYDSFALSRVARYFNIYYIVLLPKVASRLPKEIGLVFNFFICVMYFYLYMRAASANPYYFFFQQSPVLSN